MAPSLLHEIAPLLYCHKTCCHRTEPVGGLEWFALLSTDDDVEKWKIWLGSQIYRLARTRRRELSSDTSESLCQLHLLELLLLEDERQLSNEAGEGKSAVGIDAIHVLSLLRSYFFSWIGRPDTKEQTYRTYQLTESMLRLA